MKYEIIEKGGKFVVRSWFLGFIPLYYGSDGFWFWPDEYDWTDLCFAQRRFLELINRREEKKKFKQSKLTIVETE